MIGIEHKTNNNDDDDDDDDDFRYILGIKFLILGA